MESSTSSLKVEKLLPKSLAAKRRRRKERKAQEEEGKVDENGRPLSMNREFSLESSDTSSTTGRAEEDGEADDVDDRSFGSFESNVEPLTEIESSASRPDTLSTHPSLIGYLTTSSPEVQATHLDRSSQSNFALDQTVSPRSLSPRSRQQSAPPREPPIVIEPPAPVKTAALSNRRQTVPKIESTPPPRTPPGSDQSAPVIVNTPPTPTELRSSQEFAASPERRSFHEQGSPDGGSPIWKNLSSHRRAKSTSSTIVPSKLSTITAAPLTPTAETAEPSTPGSNSPSGFFSSMISAAQSAANNLSTNIQNTAIPGIGVNKPRPTTPQHMPTTPSTDTSHVEVEPAAAAKMDTSTEEKESAVRTLGAGDLSLSHLGLGEPAHGGTPVTSRFPDITDSRGRSESAPPDTQTSVVDVVADESDSRPRSLNEAGGDASPPQTSEFADAHKSSMNRSSSIRSAIKPHRKRGSSVTTGNTIGAAIAAANTSLANPAAGGAVGAPKLTGFAIASKKRNRDFHTFFKSVPDDDYLIEDYSCALQREILAHGRLYVSEGHLCFSSNILGWTTTLVMSFDEIVSVEKRSTALLFKNGLMITTLHAKHVFASFTSRDATYDLIVNIWKLGHPTLTSTLNGVRLEGTGGDKTEKLDGEPLETETQMGSDSEEESDEEEFYDEEDDENDAPDAQATDVNGLDGEGEKSTTRKASGAVGGGGSPDSSKDAAGGSGGLAVDFPGPSTHAPTDCGDASNHYDKVVADDIVPAPLGKVYSMMFGQPSVNIMSKWLTQDQKCTELQMEDKKGLSLDNRNRSFSYIKPLNASIGPKQTKCIVSETVDNIDFENAVNLSSSTQTPDVPSGNVFAVKTRYCLSWAENNVTHVLVTCTVEWTGKSWLKSPIEKGAIDGQTQHFKDLFAAFKAMLASRPRAATGTNGGPKQSSKKKSKKAKAMQSGGSTTDLNKSKRATKQDWGMLEPVRGVLEPIVDIVQPLLTGNVMYGLLVGLLVATWFGFGFTPGSNAPSFGMELGRYSPDRIAAYEEMWRREDSELWEWLEERVGMERLSTDTPPKPLHMRKRAVEPRTYEEKLREERMDDREVAEAIRVTEEKLKVLRDVMGRTGKVQDTKSEAVE